MRQAIHDAAERLGPCWSISHLVGGPGQVFRVVAGDPERVQDLLAAEASRRLQAPPSAPADLIVAGNHPWPGDPMQSFKVLLHHRAACRPGGVLVGLFWTDPAEIDSLVPDLGRCGGSPRRVPSGAGRSGGSCRLPSGSLRPSGSPAAFMLRWACELVVDRTVLVYAPPLASANRARAGSGSSFCRSSRALAGRRHGP